MCPGHSATATSIASGLTVDVITRANISFSLPLILRPCQARCNQASLATEARERQVTDFRTLQEMLLVAHERVSPELWDFINGATESESTARRNRGALDQLAFRPRVLCDVSAVDPSTSFLEQKLSIPVMMAPVGSLALIDAEGALPVARVCASMGTLMFYSTFADPPLEEVRRAVPHPLILALYVRGDQAWLDRAIDEAVAAECHAIA